LGFELTNFKQLDFDSRIFSYINGNFVYLFKLENDTNVLFYLDTSSYFRIKHFDNKGALLKENCPLNHASADLKISMLSNKYVISLYCSQIYNCSTISFFGNNVQVHYNQREYSNICIIIDDKLCYLQHRFFTTQNLLLSANSSSILSIDKAYNYHFYDSSLEINSDKSLAKIKDKIGLTIVDLEMSDSNIFCLCSTHKLVIFDLGTIDVVKEITVNATQIKLTLTGNLYLFNSTNRVICVYDSGDNFEKFDEIRLSEEKIESGLVMAKDKTDCITFYNKSKMVYCSKD
jgi:hypothetical protein